MTFQVEPHTADVRLRISASSFPDLFREAVRGLYSVMAPGRTSFAEHESSRIEIDAIDRTALLVDFLNELLYRAHVSSSVAEQIDFIALEEDRLVADVDSRCVEGFDEDVKAVTYHEAQVVEDESGQYATTLVLDI